MYTLTKTWLAQIAVVLVLAAGTAPASGACLLSGNSPLGGFSRSEDGDRASVQLSVERQQGCGRRCRYDAAGVSVEPVYNIEVEGDHCYRVGEQGLLVHNASVGNCSGLDPSNRPQQKTFLSKALKAFCPKIFARQQTIAVALMTDDDGCSLRCIVVLAYNQDDVTDKSRTGKLMSTIKDIEGVAKGLGIGFETTIVPGEFYYHAEAQLIQLAQEHKPKPSKLCAIVVSRTVCSSTTETKNKPDTSCAKRLTWVQNTKCAGIPFEVWVEECP
jgi:hypothetical protein